MPGPNAPHRASLPPRLAFRRMHFERQWYPTPRSPRFYMEPYTIASDRVPGAEVFAGVEIDLVLSGRGGFYLDGRTYELAPGTVFFYDCMIPHDFTTPGPDKLELLGAHMLVDAVIAAGPVPGDLRLYEPFVALRSGFSPLVAGPEEIAGQLRDAWEICRSRGPDWDLLAWSRVHAALTGVRAGFAEMVAEQRNPSWLQHTSLAAAAIEFIHQRYAEPIGLEGIARACACSVSSLSHVFSQVMHVSPIEYRNRLRVVRAMELLCGSNEKLSRIAAQVGFESLSQFHDLFRRVTGRTPASVRG